MIRAILSRLGLLAGMLIAVLIALITGLVYGVIGLFKAVIDGRVDSAEQRAIETSTWALAWAALRRIPGIRVD